MANPFFAPPDSSTNPYLLLGLAHNPFLAEQVPGVLSEFWIERPVPEPPQPCQQQFVQAVAEKGFGKTSLLLHWRNTIPGPYHYVPVTWGRFRSPPCAPIVYCDELDRLPWPLRRTWLRRAARARATLVVGTHVDLQREAQQAGFAVTTIYFPPVTADDVRRFAARRLEQATRPGQNCCLQLSPSDAECLARRCRGSLRELGEQLHIWAAGQARQAAGFAAVAAADDWPPSPQGGGC